MRKFTATLIIVTLFLAACNHDESLTSTNAIPSKPAPQIKPDPEVKPPVADFREKYHGKYEVKIVETYGSYYGANGPEYFDTTYSCTLSVTSHINDTVTYGTPLGVFKYPAMTFTKTDGSPFMYWYGPGKAFDKRLGMDSTGNLFLSMGAYQGNAGGFITTDSIHFEYTDQYPKLGCRLTIIGSR